MILRDSILTTLLAVWSCVNPLSAQISTSPSTIPWDWLSLTRPTLLTTVRTTREVLFTTWKQGFVRQSSPPELAGEAAAKHGSFESRIADLTSELRRYGDDAKMLPLLADAVARIHVRGELDEPPEKHEWILAQKIERVREALRDPELCVAMAEYLHCKERAAASPPYRRLREEMVRASRLCGALADKVRIDPSCRYHARSGARHVIALLMDDLDTAVQKDRDNAKADATPCPVHTECAGEDGATKCSLRLQRARCASQARALIGAASIVREVGKELAIETPADHETCRKALAEAARRIGEAAIEWRVDR